MSWFKSFWKKLIGSAPAGAEPFLDESIVNFTPRAQQVLALARREADRVKHPSVGTEHVLLGLIRLQQGVAFAVLGKMGLDIETIRREIEKQAGPIPQLAATTNRPFTPRVKKVLALALKEANSPFKNVFSRSSRGNEAQISLETIMQLAPPHGGGYFFNGLLGRSITPTLALNISCWDCCAKATAWPRPGVETVQLGPQTDAPGDSEGT